MCAHLDPYGNILHVLTMDEPLGALVLSAFGEVEIDQVLDVEFDDHSPLPFLRTSHLTTADGALVEFAAQH